jgi:aspartyl/asparaginyl-tRNA synthetase
MLHTDGAVAIAVREDQTSAHPDRRPVPQPAPLGEHLRTPELKAAMLVQQEALYAARGFLRGLGCMGVQRLVRFLTGLDALWQVSAYPKLPGVLAP